MPVSTMVGTAKKIYKLAFWSFSGKKFHWHFGSTMDFVYFYVNFIRFTNKA